MEAEGVPEGHGGTSCGFLYLHEVKHAAAGIRILPDIHVVIKTDKPFVDEREIAVHQQSSMSRQQFAI